MKPSLYKDSLFLNLLNNYDHIKVYKSGKIKNLRTGNYIGSKPPTSVYHVVCCRIPNIKQPKVIAVHRLVWLRFKGKIPYGMEINHEDGDTNNNRLSNLTCLTRNENMQHSYDRLNRRRAEGATHWKCQLTEKQILFIYNSKKLSCRQLQDKFGVSSTVVYKIRRGVSYTCITQQKAS